MTLGLNHLLDEWNSDVYKGKQVLFGERLEDIKI